MKLLTEEDRQEAAAIQRTLQSDVDWILFDRLLAQAQLAVEAVSLLREGEWAAECHPPEEHRRYCVFCDGTAEHNYSTPGDPGGEWVLEGDHAPDCKLALFFGKIET